jgi:uncharacterized protein YneF (UPF0154 family)
MHDLLTKEAVVTEGQNDRAPRWEGRAGILGSLLMLVAFVVVGAFVGMDITPEESLTRFPDIKVARIVENTLYLAALLLWVVHSLGLYRALRRRSPGPALVGAVLSILGLTMMIAGALPHVATAPLSDLYHAADATPQDQATLLLVWHGIYATLVDTFLATGLLIAPLGLIAFGRAMFEAPDFGARLGRTTVGLGMAGLAAAATLLVQDSIIAAVGVFALIGFHLIVGRRTMKLAASPNPRMVAGA